MRKIYLLLALLSAIATNSLHAQFTVEGQVQDTLGEPLANATIALLQSSDSVLVSFALSDEFGGFVFKRVSAGDYLIQCSFLGYHTMSVPADVAGNVSLPTTTMYPSTVSLSEVEITGDRTPIFIKKDTVEYNALAFKIQPGDNVEQLLKKLPGVEVDREGNVKAMGEDVQKVLVDGKEFFGDDPKVATKNLPADAVDRVQVYDKKSDLAEFTGIDDGEREKTINLKLKEDKKKGVFGNVTGGYGQTNFDDPNHLYEAKVNANKFTNKLQLSVLGMLNNNNQQGFSINEYVNFMGGLSNMMASGGRMRIGSGSSGIPMNMGGNMGTGFMKTGAGGINFNYDISKKTEIQTSYFYNDLSNTLDQTTFREQFLNNKLFTTESKSNQLTANNNHKVNVTLRHKIDSTSNLIFRANAGMNDAMMNQTSESQTLDNEGAIENGSATANASMGENVNATASLVYRKRFHKRGRALVLEANGAMQQDDQEAALTSENSFRLGSDTLRIDQDQYQTNDQTNWGAKLSYTEPLGNAKYLQLNLSRQNYNNDWNREVYNLNGRSGTRELDSRLSNKYLRGYFYDRGGLSLLVNRPKASLTASMDVQRSQLDGDLITLDTSIQQIFVNVLPGLRYRYEFAATRSISLNYRTNMREPSLEQLQPIVDNTDPLNIYVGNPELRPEYTHSANIHFMNFSRFNFTNFFGVIRATYTQNKITNSKFVDSLFRQITKPINVDQDLNLSTFINYGTPIKPIKAKIRLEGNLTYNKSILFINNQKNNVNRFMSTLGLALENRNKDKVDIMVGAKLSPTLTQYDVSTELNQNFLNQNYYADLSVNLGKKWLFTSNLDYTLYAGDAFSEDVTIALWQASLTRYVFKNRRGQLKLTAYDILNQNEGINRTSTFNYVEETRVRTLSRYVMMTFTYNLSEFGNSEGKGRMMITTRRR